MDVIYDVTGRDYIQVADTAAGYLRFNPEEIPVYVVTGSEDAYPDPDEYGVDEIEDYDEILYDARMILFTDNDENVLYAIWVDGSVWGKNDTVYAAVEDLYDAIVFDAGLPTDIEWAIDIAETLLALDADKWTSNDVTNAGLAIEILNATENAGYEALAEDLSAKMDAADGALALAAARYAAISTVEDTIWAGVEAQAAIDGVTGLVKDEVLADDTTAITVAGLAGGTYGTVADAVATWTDYVNGLDDINVINNWAAAQSVEGGLIWQVGTAYVTAVKTAQDDANAAAADKKAVEDALAAIDLKGLKVEVADSAKASSDVATAVKTAVEDAIDASGITDAAEVTVTSWDANTSVGSTAQAQCTVKVTLTKNAAEASESFDISVSVTVNA